MEVDYGNCMRWYSQHYIGAEVAEVVHRAGLHPQAHKVGVAFLHFVAQARVVLYHSVRTVQGYLEYYDFYFVFFK